MSTDAISDRLNKLAGEMRTAGRDGPVVLLIAWKRDGPVSQVRIFVPVAGYGLSPDEVTKLGKLAESLHDDVERAITGLGGYDIDLAKTTFSVKTEGAVGFRGPSSTVGFGCHGNVSYSGDEATRDDHALVEAVEKAVNVRVKAPRHLEKPRSDEEVALRQMQDRWRR